MTLVILLIAVPVIAGGIGFLALTRARPTDTVHDHQEFLSHLPRRGNDPTGAPE